MAMKVILCGLLKGSLPNLLYASFLNQQVTTSGPVAGLTGLATLSSNVNNTRSSDTAVHWDTFRMQNTVSPSIDLQVVIDSPSREVDFFTNSSPVSTAPKALPQVPCKHLLYPDITTSLPFVDLLIAVCVCRLLLCIYHGRVIIGKGCEDSKQENDGNDFLQLDGHFVEYHLFPVLDEYYEYYPECTSIEEVLDCNNPPQQVLPVLQVDVEMDFIILDPDSDPDVPGPNHENQKADPLQFELTKPKPFSQALPDPINSEQLDRSQSAASKHIYDPQQAGNPNYLTTEADLDQVQLAPEQNHVPDPIVPMQTRYSRLKTGRIRPYLSRKAKKQTEVAGFYTESLARPTNRLRPYHSRRCKQKTTQTGFYKD